VRRFQIVVGMTLLLVLTGQSAVRAHAGHEDVAVQAATSGPFEVLLWANESVDEAGRLPILVQIIADEIPVDDADVRMWVVDEQGMRLHGKAATRSALGPGFWTSALKVGPTGRGEVKIDITDSTGRLGEASFRVGTAPPEPWMKVVVGFAAIVTSTFSVWMVWRGWRAWAPLLGRRGVMIVQGGVFDE